MLLQYECSQYDNDCRSMHDVTYVDVRSIIHLRHPGVTDGESVGTTGHKVICLLSAEIVQELQRSSQVPLQYPAQSLWVTWRLQHSRPALPQRATLNICNS